MPGGDDDLYHPPFPPFPCFHHVCVCVNSAASKTQNKNRLCSMTCGIDKIYLKTKKNYFMRSRHEKIAMVARDLDS